MQNAVYYGSSTSDASSVKRQTGFNERGDKEEDLIQSLRAMRYYSHSCEPDRSGNKEHYTPRLM